MKKSEVFHAWASILAGRAPSLSIEITKECPLRCPGCYAFDAAHLGGTTQLRQLSDFKGDELVTRILVLLDELKPLHVSLVGGDPLVRYRELEQLLPQIEARDIHAQVVTSAFRVIPRQLEVLQKAERSRLDRRPSAGARRAQKTSHLRSNSEEYRRRRSHDSLHDHLSDCFPFGVS